MSSDPGADSNMTESIQFAGPASRIDAFLRIGEAAEKARATSLQSCAACAFST